MPTAPLLQDFYFSRFEGRQPYASAKRSPVLSVLFQFFGLLFIILGTYYLYWRWSFSLNREALWFSLPLVLAESMAFLSSVLVVFNYWDNKDLKIQKPPRLLSDIEEVPPGQDRPLVIDVFIATYNEDEELVRYSIRDALRLTYPHPDVTIKVWVLDDGRRPAMKQVAEEEGVLYLSRKNNEGYKAGNLKHAIENSTGDLFIILDADTRTFPKFLEHTAGYFRNKKMAWVQTPQWFYDLTEAVPLTKFFRWVFNKKEPVKANLLDKTLGKITVGEDVFGNDPRIFYDVILRRRNIYNAAFCCGAGSIHRRKAVLQTAMAIHDKKVRNEYQQQLSLLGFQFPDARAQKQLLEKIRSEVEVRPFVYHASEDIYTSLLLHADSHDWQSYQHPQVECKMLSTQDLDGWVKQRTRYASGSLDIAFKDNPLFMKGLSLSQRLCYFQTIYSYFAPLWLLVFLLSPAIFFFTLTPPVSTFNFDFFKIFIPFQILNVLTMTFGTWGIPTTRADQYYVSSFALMLQSMWATLRGQKVRFHVTRKTGFVATSLKYVWPHLLIIGVTTVGVLYNLWLIRQGTHPSYSGFVANVLWTAFNFYCLNVIIMAAFWKSNTEK